MAEQLVGFTDIELIARLAERLGHTALADKIREEWKCVSDLPQSYFLTESSGIADSTFEENDFKSPADYFRETRKKPPVESPKR